MKKSVIVMGVAGCGKSSLGAMLAEGMGVTLVEGDDYHSPTSREKMGRGIPLTDADRQGWLETLGELLRRFQQGQGHPGAGRGAPPGGGAPSSAAVISTRQAAPSRSSNCWWRSAQKNASRPRSPASSNQRATKSQHRTRLFHKIAFTGVLLCGLGRGIGFRR